MREALSVTDILRKSALAVVRSPHAFARAFWPVAAGEAVLRIFEATAPDSVWTALAALAQGAILLTVFSTNWHRHLILGAPPAFRWRLPETRYLVLMIMLTLVLAIPMLSATLGATWLLVDESFAQLPPIGPAISAIQLAVILLMVALSAPLWLWLPSEALGRAVSYVDIQAMTRRHRGRLVAVLAIPMVGYLGAAWAAEEAGVPEFVIALTGLAVYVILVGALSFAYMHLRLEPPAVTGEQRA